MSQYVPVCPSMALPAAIFILFAAAQRHLAS
jgi:hypothetical protein